MSELVLAIAMLCASPGVSAYSKAPDKGILECQQYYVKCTTRTTFPRAMLLPHCILNKKQLLGGK
jgi:hypothetical protein